MNRAVRGWVGRTSGALRAQVGGVSAADRRGALVGLVVVAGGAATAKSVLIADERWSVGAQVGLVATVVVVTSAVLAAGTEPDDGRAARVVRSLGLAPLPRRTGDRRTAYVVVPLLVGGAVTVVGLLLRSEPGHLDVVDLALLVAGAEELIYRGAVLALAHRALPPVAAEVVTAVAFGLSHLGNDTGWARLAGVGVPIAGGLAFSWLRHRSGSLAGPIAGHIATNLPGRVLAG